MEFMKPAWMPQVGPLRKSADIVDASEQYPAAKGVDFPMPVLLPPLPLNLNTHLGIKITTPEGVVILIRSVQNFRGFTQVCTPNQSEAASAGGFVAIRRQRTPCG